MDILNKDDERVITIHRRNGTVSTPDLDCPYIWSEERQRGELQTPKGIYYMENMSCRTGHNRIVYFCTNAEFGPRGPRVIGTGGLTNHFQNLGFFTNLVGWHYFHGICGEPTDTFVAMKPMEPWMILQSGGEGSENDPRPELGDQTYNAGAVRNFVPDNLGAVEITQDTFNADFNLLCKNYDGLGKICAPRLLESLRGINPAYNGWDACRVMNALCVMFGRDF